MGFEAPLPAGVVLAGGLSRRMAGLDKACALLGGETLLERALRRLSPQVAGLAVNANLPPERLPPLGGVPVLVDVVGGFAGPLAGVHAGLVWARAMGHRELVTVAVDTPFFPDDLARRLSGNGLAVAMSGGRVHPVFASWPVALEERLSSHLAQGGARVMGFLEDCGFRTEEWPVGDCDPFFNINTPADLAAAEARL
ncbi:MAG: molybdenum cofactor guanylyltransferase [Mesorhizobium amorphae]|nr:MAG: molybdenum cofactor guanylyltransferase [Mesorhizobium amorphae]